MSDRPLVVVVSGSRTWTSATVARQELERLVDEHEAWTRPCVLVHGACRGADLIAAGQAHELGWTLLAMAVTPAQWRTQGRAAGVLRNAQMLEVARPDVVLALREAGESRGTDDMVRRAREWQRVNAHLRLVRLVHATLVQGPVPTGREEWRLDAADTGASASAGGGPAAKRPKLAA